LSRISGKIMAVILALVVLIVLALWLLPEGPYKVFMKWVNFGILAFFAVKFGKDPLMNFLYGERDRIKVKLDEINDQISKAESLVNEETRKLKDVDRLVEKIRGDILAMGEREKTLIIEDAAQNSNQMIKDAEAESDLRLKEAIKKLNDDIVERAVSIAEEKIKNIYNAKDNEKAIDKFVGGLGKVKESGQAEQIVQ